MLSAWSSLSQSKKNHVNVGKLQLAIGGGALIYGIYRTIKSRNYLQNRQDDAFPNNADKMKEVSTIIGPMLFIDNINTIRINVVGSIIHWFIVRSVIKVKKLHDHRRFHETISQETPNIIYQYFQDYALLAPIWAAVLNLAFNIASQYKTRPDMFGTGTAIKRICASALSRTLIDSITIPCCSWFAVKASAHPSIEPYADPLFVWNNFFHRWYGRVSLSTAAVPFAKLTNWIRYTLCPYGYFTSSVHHLAQVIFGYKFKWRLFESQEKRYKELQKAMECFELKFSSVLSIDQETIDRKYNEMNANKQKQSEHSYYILSSFVSYWKIQRYGAVNLWLYSVLV